MRVRHFGYLASAAGAARRKIRDQLGAGPEPDGQLTELDPFICPICEIGKLVFIAKIAPTFVVEGSNRGPPQA